MITDKNKEQFEKWLLSTPFEKHIESSTFYSWFFEMQIGVLLAYYDSLGYDISTFQTLGEKIGYDTWAIKGYSFHLRKIKGGKCIWDIGMDENDDYKSRNEAYKQAFIKANEIVNNN